MVNLPGKYTRYEEKGGGTIIEFQFIGGLMGLPFQSFYSAGKFAMRVSAKALKWKSNSLIKIVLLNPGDFHTNNSANRRISLHRPIE